MESSAQTIAQTAELFLLSGRANGLDQVQLAETCNTFINMQAGTSLKTALKSARMFVRRAEEAGGPLTLTAYRALARVTHMGGGYADAESAYLTARNLAGNDRRTKALIDRALIDVYMYLGDLAQARRRARQALDAFTRLDSPSDVAKTRVNYGNLLHRQDRHREAEELYRLASEYFESTGDELSAARCYYNRANSLVQLFDMAPASSLYEDAREIYRSKDMLLEATDARYGLAWLKMLQGAFHVALRELAECEQVYREAGQPKGAALCELDRAEVYLGLNLFPDARDSARRSRLAFRKLGIRYEAAKASYFLARAEFALENNRAARTALRSAVEGFTREKNFGFQGACYLLAAQMATRQSIAKTEITRARRVFAKAQLPLWETMADLYSVSVAQKKDDPLRRLQNNKAVKQIPHLFAWWQTLLGDRAALKGMYAAAVNHWTRAADRLDLIRAQLPPVEIRTHFGRQDSSPHRKLIEMVVDRNPSIAAVWVERYQTAGVWAPVNPVLIPDAARRRVEESLSQLAAQVASYSHSLPSASGERGGFSSRAQVEVERLQKKVRQELAAIEQTDGKVDDIARLRENFRELATQMPVVQFHVGDAGIYAFVHTAGGTKTCKYNNGIIRLSQYVKQWRFLLERELLANHLKDTSDVEAERRFFSSLGEWLWKPLDIPSSASQVLIIPQGDLANIPWEAMIVDNIEIAQRHRIILSPSLRHFMRAKSITADSADVEIFVGQVDDLPEVSTELRTLLSSAGPSGRLHDPASRSSWPLTGSARVWHFAGHSQLRADNPFYSYLHLADGPLFAADFRIRDVKLHLATLAACRSGEQVALSGEESTGLVRSLLEMGARNIVAGRWPVSDKSTAVWMSSFYEAFFSGNSTTSAAHIASGQVRDKFPSAYHWAAFSVFGAGD